MVKSDACKEKAALLVLIGSVVVVGGATSRGAMNWLVPCLVEFLRSEDWTVRKAIAEALGKVALKKLSVLALQSNQLTGAIPASLGDLGILMRLDLSSNHLFGSIPTRLADVPSLQVLDVPSLQFYYNALKRLDDGFVYEHNSGLCGVVFSSLKACDASDHVNSSRTEPYGAGVDGLTRYIPETATVKLPGIIMVSIAISAIGILTFALYRRRKQRLGNAFDIS